MNQSEQPFQGRSDDDRHEPHDPQKRGEHDPKVGNRTTTDPDADDTDTAPDESSHATIDRLEQEVEDAKRRVLIAHADLENTRKRLRRDYEDQLKFAPSSLIRDLLTVLDNLYRAIDASAGNESSSGLVEGVKMVASQFEETLAKYECRPIPSKGEPFDPNYHEAIAQMPCPDVPAGIVAQVAVQGYQLHDRVVRPSQVLVSTGPPSK